MKLSYRNQRNAEAAARYWNKPLDRPDWFKINAIAGDSSEILIYDVIGWPYNDSIELVRTVADMKGRDILVRINSPGGDVFDSMAIYNAFKGHDAKVTTRIESLAASSASFIAIAGKEVQANQNAMFMIHEPWAYMAGNQYDLRETADVLGKISGNMVDIYASESSVGKKEARDMMKAETWLTAKEAKEKGFINTILDGKAARAAFDLSLFANVPDDLLNDNDLTERDAEKALRDAGFSRAKAKAMLAGRQQTESDDNDIVTEINAISKILGGK